MEPLISVIVPVYRVETYLGRCVDSILLQTYQNLEIILVDDGSPDNCPALCDDYTIKDKRVQVIHQNNLGLSGARNSGIEASHGEYLAFVDADDYLSPDFVKSLYEVMEKTNATIGQCRFAYVKGEALPESHNEIWKIFRGESLMEQLYGPEEEATYFVVAWNKLYRRELFQKIRFPQGRIHEDEATTYYLFHEAKKLTFLEQPLYGYFTENTGSITAKFSRKRLQWLTAHEERITFFKENGYETLLPKAYRKLLDACITFYFRCTDEVEDAAEIRKELKGCLQNYRKQGAEFIKMLPFKTRFGYALFLVSPWLYYKVLKQIRERI